MVLFEHRVDFKQKLRRISSAREMTNESTNIKINLITESQQESGAP